MERSPATGHGVSDRADGDRVAKASVRPAGVVGPERVKAAVPLPVFSSYAAGVGKRPERDDAPTAM